MLLKAMFQKIVIRTLSLRKQRSSHRSSYHRCSIKKLFIKDLQYLRKTPVLESLFHKFTGLKTCNFIKKRLQHRCSPVNIAKFLRTPFLNNICKRLVLQPPEVFYKKKFLKISQNLQENTSTRGSFVIKLRPQHEILLKRYSGKGVFL